MTAAEPVQPATRQWAPGSVNIPRAKWPVTARDTSIDAAVVASQVIDSLNQSLAKNNIEGIQKLFCGEGYWRDHLALTWDLRTMKGSDRIASFLEKGHSLLRVEIDASSPERAPKVTALDPMEMVKGIQFFTTVTTKFGAGRGLVKLVEEDGQWKIWTCFTTLEELSGFEETTGPKRPMGVQHGAVAGRKNWLDRRNGEVEFGNGSPDVLVLGGGQAGLTVHARLKMLDVPTLIIDSNKEVGDNWRKRYHQLVLHDPVWYDHMPYINFPKSWPVYTPKDKLAAFFKSYAQMMELNVWTSTTIESVAYDEKQKQWTVVVKRVLEDNSTEIRTLNPKHMVQATGHSGKKNQADIPGYESFKGDRICHSSEFTGARKNGKGKNAVVIGSCNSAMDICQAFYEQGYDVTVVQRSSTAVSGCDTVTELLLGGVYREDGPPVEDADILVWGSPSEVFKAMHGQLTEMAVKRDAAMLDGLANAGFKTDRGPDGCGIFVKYFQRGGGYYFDVGSSQLIIDGKIKVKQGHEVAEILSHGVRLADDAGTELDADEIVVATGYQNMRTATQQIFGDEVASRVGDVWGFDEEGEMRVIWRRNDQPGLWLHGGNLAMCRYYSRIVALQIKAQIRGLSG